MSDTETTTVTISRPGFAEYTLRYHNQTVADFHALQKKLGTALFELGDEYAGSGDSKKSK